MRFGVFILRFSCVIPISANIVKEMIPKVIFYTVHDSTDNKWDVNDFLTERSNALIFIGTGK